VAGEANPTLRRRELGFLLRKLRTDRGLTIEDVSERLLFSPTKLSRLETGRAGASPRDIRDLCLLYEVNDPVERGKLAALAREGKQRAWWQKYALPYATYVGLEAEAASISDFNSDLVTGLLQVEGYARAILETAEPPLERAVIDQYVEARLRRQAVLDGPDSPLSRFVVDEQALRRLVGSPAVMHAQMKRIVTMAKLPNVTFQILPVRVGAHTAMGSPFTILEFDEPAVNNVVYVEGLVGNIYLEDATDVDRYKLIFSRLSSIALNPEDSIEMAESIAATYKDG
jgi:transcriptional regulator with XRE-family HTH domain